MNPLAKLLLAGSAARGDAVKVSLSGGKLNFEVETGSIMQPGRELVAEQ